MNTPQVVPKPKLKFWWGMLIVSTIVSIVLNMWHALSTGASAELVADACAVSAQLCERATELANHVEGIHPVLGAIFALVPPGFAAALSHGLISEFVANVVKVAIVGIFGVSIVTSITSQAAVMKPYGGDWGQWSIPVILDFAALIALYVITVELAGYRKKIKSAEADAEVISVKAEIRAALEGEVRCELEGEIRGELRCELTPEIRGEVEGELRGEHAREIAAAVKAAQDELRRELEGEANERVRTAEVAAEARVRTELAGQNKGKKPARKPSAQPVSAAANDELSSEDRARMLIAANPNISGGELGLALGRTKRYGQVLLAKIKEETAPSDVVPLRAVND